MNLYHISYALNLSALYMIAGTGACFSIKSGDLNIGGEGQIYAGGFICAIILNALKNRPTVPAFLIAIISSMLISGFLMFFCAFLKKTKKAVILLTSYIVSAAIIPLLDGLIAGPFRGNSNNLLSTEYLAQKFRFASIMKPGPMNISFFFAIILCAIAGLVIFKTAYGKQLCIYGISEEYSEFSNFNTTALSFTSAFTSGAFHGLCGAFAICGTYFTCHNGFYVSMGWNALTCALIARSNPFLLFPSSIFMGFMVTYANKYALYHNFSFDMSSLIQSVFLLLIAFPIFSESKRRITAK